MGLILILLQEQGMRMCTDWHFSSCWQDWSSDLSISSIEDCENGERSEGVKWDCFDK